MRVLSSKAAWCVFVVAAVVILAIGANHPPPSSEASRISQLDSIIKCPSCEDLSIAQSQASSSATLRSEVAGWVRQGWSNQQVEQAVVARYGQAGLLVPDSGARSLLYVVPLGLVAVAVALMGAYFWRRQRSLRPARARAA